MAMSKMRVISQGNYEDRGYSNEESIAYLQLQKPVEINSFLTYNYGMDDDVTTDSKVSYTNALKVLKRITDNWFYLNLRTDTVDNIDYTGYRARLLAFRDISDLVSGSDITKDYVGDTMTSTVYNDNYIYSISNKKVITDKTKNDEYDLIPVITVSKDKIKR